MMPLSTSILIFINLLFSACSTTPEHDGKFVPVEDRSVTDSSHQDVTSDSRADENTKTMIEPTQSDVSSGDIRREESISEQLSSSVALAFLHDADKYTSAGDSARAVASLERGLDIEPKNPWLWNRLASESLKQTMWSKAITLAKKSNAFSDVPNHLQKHHWHIISQT